MHLLVLSAFRHKRQSSRRSETAGLNAPFGAQCFPTAGSPGLQCCGSRSQCTFWCSVLSDTSTSPHSSPSNRVSMHLLVLSAFRLNISADQAALKYGLNAPFGAQCFPTPRAITGLPLPTRSQCTFWCSVLSDAAPLPHTRSPVRSLNAPFGAQCFPTR